MPARVKPLFFLVAAIFVLLQYALWFGEKNLFDWWNLQHTVSMTQAEIAQLQRENDRLTVEVLDLKQSGDSVETLARSQYGMIKRGETFYQIIEGGRPENELEIPPLELDSEFAPKLNSELDR